MRREKEQELDDDSPASLFVHTGYRCDGCGQDPIKGGRFICIECDLKNDSVDFCLDCAPKNLALDDKPTHLPSHEMRPVRKKLIKDGGGSVDNDYLFQNNYLDPNFL